ncbi:hypothetical protein [Helicobacter sp. MIT 99-5507]|uniref:hypothetical protein n=1 Tax=Helicobacter sp. MIT 99-5507 TaxID=152489 RepID=UPI0015F195C9|nr:hypothetical protein [Helicobacter sp. MIT 99-5507]
MIATNYNFGLIFSAVITMAVIVIAIRIYLNIVNRKSDIGKPDWMSDSEFEDRFGKRKR